MRYKIVKNIASLGSASLIVSAFAFLTLPLNVSSLGINGFGKLALIQAYISLISGVLSFETWQPVVKFGIKYKRQESAILGCGVLLDVLASALAFLISISILSFTSLVGEEGSDVAILSAIYSASLLFGISNTPKGYFRLHGMMGILALNQIWMSCANLIASIIMWATNASLFTYIVTFATISSVYNISIFARMLLHLETSRLNFPWNSKNGWRLFLSIGKNSVSTSVTSSLSTIRRQLSVIIISYFHGDAATAIFSLSQRVVNSFSKITHIINQSIFAEVIKAMRIGDREAILSMTRKANIFSWIFSVLAFVLVYFSSDFLIEMISDHSVPGISLVIALLMGAECFILASLHFNPIIQSRCGAGPIVKVAFLATIIYLIASFILSKSFGGVGAAGATLLSSLVLYCGYYFKSRACIMAI